MKKRISDENAYFKKLMKIHVTTFMHNWLNHNQIENFKLTFNPVVLHTSCFNDNGVCCSRVKTSDQNVILWKLEMKIHCKMNAVKAHHVDNG